MGAPAGAHLPGSTGNEIKMALFLEPIPIDADKTEAVYASEDCLNLLKMWEEYYPKIGFNLPWVGYFIKQDNEIIGSCAFTGPPENNRVEVSYWTFKEYEGKGVATFACRQLVFIAKATDPFLVITAKTAPENNASTKVLQRNGFVFSGIVQDHEIGDAWEWVLSPAN
jgi:RimJ/RimL family protein N-acetyltransferase